jgi:hypothetical protein
MFNVIFLFLIYLIAKECFSIGKSISAQNLRWHTAIRAKTNQDFYE